MTNTNKTKTVKAAETAAVVATEEKAAGFDMAAALKAAQDAPANRGGRTGGALMSVVRGIIEAAEGPLAMSQIQAAYFAGMNIAPNKKDAKRVYETVFQHSDACHNKGVDVSRAVFTRNAEGAYSIA